MRDQKYENLKDLGNKLEQLFELCGIETSDIDIKHSPLFVKLAEFISRDNSVADFAAQLHKTADKALKKLDEDKSNNWCDEQEKRLLDDLEKQIEELRQHNHELEIQLEKISSAMSEKENQSAKFVKGFTNTYDSLYSRLEVAKNSLSADDNVIKLLNNQLLEAASTMRNLGITVLDDTDHFDDSYCAVTETVHTDNMELIGKIAGIFRPGYKYDGKVLKSKEVILYSE